MPKCRYDVRVRQLVARRLEAEAARRDQPISATIDQLLYETLPPADDEAPTATAATETSADTLPPCPYLTRVDGTGDVWDAVAAQREGLTPAQFAKKYGRRRDTGQPL